MRVPIDNRALRDIDGVETDLFFDVEQFLVGICVLVGSSWVLENRRVWLRLQRKLAWPFPPHWSN